MCYDELITTGVADPGGIDPDTDLNPAFEREKKNGPNPAVKKNRIQIQPSKNNPGAISK